MGSDHDRDEDEEAELAAAEEEVSGHPLLASSPVSLQIVWLAWRHPHSCTAAHCTAMLGCLLTSNFFPGLPTTHAPAPFQPFASHLLAVCIALQQAMEDEEDGMGLHGEDEEGDEEVRCCSMVCLPLSDCSHAPSLTAVSFVS